MARLPHISQSKIECRKQAYFHMLMLPPGKELIAHIFMFTEWQTVDKMYADCRQTEEMASGQRA